jgi:hypothetical protein
VLGVALATLLVATALGKMSSVRLDRHLCETTHGGKFVDIPGFPGEQIDRRLLPDIRWMVRKYNIFVLDGYALTGHAWNGEHPIGLALDIAPNKASGGSWREIAHLARWAEPEQNDPRPPFRWVGWNGDEDHGRGDHLHLSWMHSETERGNPARVVYTRKCPERHPRQDGPDGGPGSDPAPDEPSPEEPAAGGVGAGHGYVGDGGTEPSRLDSGEESGGVEAKRLARRIAGLQGSGPQHD